MSVAVKTSGPAAQSVNTLRRALRQLSPAQPAHNFVTMEAMVRESIAEERFLLMLLAAFGGVALILASSGVYGVMSYAVSTRTHEIGVRLALGAASGSMMKQVLGRAMALAMVGSVIGGGAAWAVVRLVENLLFGVRAGDPVTFLGVSIVLMSVAVLAAYVPARRAARVDPMVVLRAE